MGSALLRLVAPMVPPYGRRGARPKGRTWSQPAALPGYGVRRWGPGPRFARLTPVRYLAVTEDDTFSAPFMDSLASDDVSEEAQLAVEEARRRLSEVPAEIVVANHAMGLFELAAIHLSHVPPRLSDASLSIDALAALVERLGPRLGEHHETLAAALSNIRLVYVQRADQ